MQEAERGTAESPDKTGAERRVIDRDSELDYEDDFGEADPDAIDGKCAIRIDKVIILVSVLGIQCANLNSEK